MKQKNIAYFSMEFAFHSDMPNYAGGLGVLAADMMKSCADLNIPAVGVTLFYHRSDSSAYAFPIGTYLKNTGKTITVKIEHRYVKIAIWKMELIGEDGGIVPILFLSANLKENEEWDRNLTKHLYAPDEYTRISQEAILGIGGVRALEELGYTIDHYHMNEGHSSLLTLELLNRFNGDILKVKKISTFTTHTPVKAGFDRFNLSMVKQVLTDFLPNDISDFMINEKFGMAKVGFSLSKAINSVSKKHQQVCVEMFPKFDFLNITNGIHMPSWIGTEMKILLDKYLPGWTKNPEILLDAPYTLPKNELFIAHMKQKEKLCTWINSHYEFFAFNDVSENDHFDSKTLTVSFARRYVPYKRHELIFQDIEKLLKIGNGKLQLIFAGHCNQDDNYCNSVRESIYKHAVSLRGKIKIVVISNYNLKIARKLVTGSDIWLNTPVPPREASGTSGMKAALNGVLNLSVADGWWIEGYDMFPYAGWSFLGTESQHGDYLNHDDSYELLIKLEDAIYQYYNHPNHWHKRMSYAIALLSKFNTHRTITEYQKTLWF